MSAHPDMGGTAVARRQRGGEKIRPRTFLGAALTALAYSLVGSRSS